MAGLSIKIDGSRVDRNLRRIERRLGNLRPVMAAIGQLAVTSIRRNFEEGGRPEKWRPLKASTIRGQWTAGNRARKRKRAVKAGGKFSAGYKRFAAGKKVLIRSGRLLRSINARPGRRQVWVGTNLKYAAIHHFGGRAGRGHKTIIPARPFLMLQAEDHQEIRALLARHATGERG